MIHQAHLMNMRHTWLILPVAETFVRGNLTAAEILFLPILVSDVDVYSVHHDVTVGCDCAGHISHHV